MSRETLSIVGSGTIEAVRNILPTAQRGINSLGEGKLYGTNVNIINPEDLLAKEAFKTSGITVGGTSIQILNAITNPLPRNVLVKIANQGPHLLYVGHGNINLVDEGFPVQVSGTPLDLTVLHNVDIWARSLGTSSVRLLIL